MWEPRDCTNRSHPQAHVHQQAGLTNWTWDSLVKRATDLNKHGVWFSFEKADMPIVRTIVFGWCENGYGREAVVIAPSISMVNCVSSFSH